MDDKDIRELIEEAHHRNEIVTLTGANFYEIDLSGADLSRANLKGTQFSHCNLTNGDLQGADLRGCRLEGSNLNGANLSEARLDGADLSQVQLRGANLTRACLRRANLTKTDLSGADLSGADLSGIVFAPAYEHPELQGALCDDQTKWSENLDQLMRKQVVKAKEIVQKRQEEQIIRRQLEEELVRLQKVAAANQQKWEEMAQEKAALQKIVETQRQNLEAEEARRRQLEVEKSKLQQLLESRRQSLESLGQSGALGKFYLAILNPIREAAGLLPLFTLPKDDISPSEKEMAERAYGLLGEVHHALRQNQRVDPSQKLSLKRQTQQAPKNISTLLWKLSRLRRAKNFVGSEAQAEIEKLENKLLTEIQYCVDILEDVLMSTMKLEMAGGNRPIERVLQDLQASNERMRDLADVYDEIKGSKSINN